jgi:hypothetical protein
MINDDDDLVLAISPARADRSVCTYCGREGHRAHACPLRRSSAIGCRAAYHSAGLVARVVLAFGALDRPDRIVTAASLVAAVVGFVILVTTGDRP